MKKHYDDMISCDENGCYKSELPEEEKMPKKSAFPIKYLILAAAVLSVIPLSKLIYSEFDISVTELIIYVIAMILFIYFVWDTCVKINRYQTLVEKCTQLVNAQCISVTPVVWKNGRLIYHPVYKYVWDGVGHVGSIGNTETKRKMGEVYPILINPSDPYTIYDPFTKREKPSAIIAKAICRAIIPTAILAILILFLKFGVI